MHDPGTFRAYWRGATVLVATSGAGFGNDIYVRQYKQGTFMLDIVDPASRELIWRGVAGKRLNSGTPQERDDYVRGIVSAILAEFPPTLVAAN